jgi:hypothetical protein
VHFFRPGHDLDPSEKFLDTKAETGRIAALGQTMEQFSLRDHRYTQVRHRHLEQAIANRGKFAPDDLAGDVRV